MHNLGTVIGFEFTRTLRKPSFWVGTLAVPLVLLGFMALLLFSSGASSEKLSAQKDARIEFAFSDDSGYITDEVAGRFGGTRINDHEEAVNQVRSGDLDAYFAYPKDPAVTPVEVYGSDTGIFDAGKHQAVASELLRAAVTDTIGSPSLAALAEGKAQYEETLYLDGEESAGIIAAVPPMAFVALFYLVMLFTGSQTIASTLEEKENRVTEMIATSLSPTTLLTGKVIALGLVATVQLTAILLPGAIGLLLAAPGLEAATGIAIPAPDPAVMAAGAALLAAGVFLFTATLVALGAILPTAKEANNAFTVIALLIFIPLYAAPMTATDPESPLVQFLTIFPFSAPATALLRNSFGTLSGVEATVVTAEMLVVGVLIFAAAVRIFRQGGLRLTRPRALAFTR